MAYRRIKEGDGAGGAQGRPWPTRERTLTASLLTPSLSSTIFGHQSNMPPKIDPNEIKVCTARGENMGEQGLMELADHLPPRDRWRGRSTSC